MRLSADSSLADVAAAASAALERHGVEAALAGGGCASLWSGGRYSSLDLDFIVTAPAARRAQEEAMASVGFTRDGDRFVHPAVRFWIEFPRGPLAIGSDLAVRPVEIRLGRLRVRGLSATDSCRDRLAAFYFWSDRQSLQVAVWIALRNRVDSRLIRKWSLDEGHVAGFDEFAAALKRARKERTPAVSAPGARRAGRGALGVLLTFAALSGSGAAAQSWSGYVEAKGFAYAERSLPREPWVVGWGTAQLTFEERLSPALRLAATARAEAMSTGDRDVFLDLADRDLRRAPFSLREAWLSWSVAPSVDVEAGRFLLGWGKTDGYSPADAFLPRDLTDPFADEKLPLWGLRSRGQAGALRFDGVWVPLGTPWRVPVSSPRFAPVEAPSGLGFPVVLVDGENELPRAGWGALRLLATFGDWDVGAWGRAGVRPAPLLTPRPDQAYLDVDAIALPADRRYARENAAGVELSRVTGAWILRAEGAALFSADAGLGDALIWTVGAERAFGDGTLLLTLAANARATPVDPLLLFDRAFLPAAVAVWQRTERWGSWRAVWTQGLRHGDGLVKGELSWNATDALALTVGGDVPYGSRYGPFGARPDLKRARAAARLAW